MALERQVEAHHCCHRRGFSHCSSETKCLLSLTSITFFFLLIHCPIPHVATTHTLNTSLSHHPIIPLPCKHFLAHYLSLILNDLVQCFSWQTASSCSGTLVWQDHIYIHCLWFTVVITITSEWVYLLCTSAWIHQIIGCRYSMYTYTMAHAHMKMYNVWLWRIWFSLSQERMKHID